MPISSANEKPSREQYKPLSQQVRPPALCKGVTQTTAAQNQAGGESDCREKSGPGQPMGQGGAGRSGRAVCAGGESAPPPQALPHWDRDCWMDRVDECGTGGSVLPLSLPVPDPSGLVTCGAFGEPVAAQAEFTGADEKRQLEVFLKI